MEKIIDLCAYLPEESLHIQPAPVKKHSGMRSILLTVEAIVTGVIGISMMVGIGAFLLML